jgi:hypothetical protein
VPLIALLVGGALFGIAFLRSRAQARAKRLQSINLVKIPKRQPSTESAVSAAATAPRAPTPTPKPPDAAARPYPDWRTPKPPSGS